MEIRFTGLRSGEKLFEDRFHVQETPPPANCLGLLVAVQRTTDAVVMGWIDEIAALTGARDGGGALARLAAGARVCA